MNLTRLEKAVVQRKFIRYCIKVLDGEALNYLDEMDKIWEREINFSELREEILDGFCSYDEFMEIRYFQIMGMEVPVKDEAISEGVYQMGDLRYGKYLVREKTAPEGFVLDEGVYGVSIEENGKTYAVENKAGVGFINTAQKCSLKIVKTSSNGKLDGFSFRVTGTDYDQTFKTDKNGEIFIEGLRIGEYTVSEVSDNACQTSRESTGKTCRAEHRQYAQNHE